MDDFDKLITRLNASKAVVAMGVAKGVKKAALLVQSDAKRLVPVDTGRLRNSITIESVVTETGAEASVGSNVEYAPYMEYGTGRRGDTTVEHRQDRLGVPPHPYLRPALEVNRENIRAIIGNEIRKAVK